MTASKPDTSIGAVQKRTIVSIIGLLLWVVIVTRVPLRPSGGIAEPALPLAASRAWRAAGCQNCHSVFGLGGHTGPDLTNVVSRIAPAHIRVLVRNGLQGMPAYDDLAEQSLDRIIEYLGAVDALATYPPRSLASHPMGTKP